MQANLQLFQHWLSSFKDELRQQKEKIAINYTNFRHNKTAEERL